MTVYILMEQWGDCEPQEIVAVFDTREAAEAEADQRTDPEHPARPSYYIQTFEVRQKEERS